MRDVPVAELAERLLPWTIAGFFIMVISGSLLFYAIPLRSFQSIFFRVKMIMLLLAGLNVLIFHSGVYKQVETWSLDAKPPRAARVAGAFSLVLWIGIVLSGRMIAIQLVSIAIGSRNLQSSISLRTACQTGRETKSLLALFTGLSRRRLAIPSGNHIGSFL